MPCVDVYAALCRFLDNDKEVCLLVSTMTVYIMLVSINIYAGRIHIDEHNNVLKAIHVFKNVQELYYMK